MEVGQQYNNRIFRVLLVGSGQLGSRHLQGILKCAYVSEVYVVDAWEKSLELARQRSQELVHDKLIHYSKDCENIPQNIDVCIIAGTANVRLSQLRQVLEKCSVRYLILEKILYNSMQDYVEADTLIGRHVNMKTWVNHPRRMYRFYSAVRGVVESCHGLMNVNVSGGNWGLACNGLHFIDLWCYLRDTDVESVDFMNSSVALIPSKRNDFIEFMGGSLIVFRNGDIMDLHSSDTEFNGMNIKFGNANCSFEIIEREELTCKDVLREGIIVSGAPQFQSDLTNEIVNDLFEKSFSSLTPYSTAQRSHRLFIESALELYNRESGQTFNYIPIT